MKCPKCGYIGFEQTDRCRNCGYDFVLAASPAPEADLPLRKGEAAALGDFDLGDAAPPSDPSRGGHRRYDPDLDPRVTPAGKVSAADLPLFQDAGEEAEDVPLVPSAAPTPPLAVRRSTPPAIRTRPRPTPRVVAPAAPESRLPLADVPFGPPAVEPSAAVVAPPVGGRILAGVLDWALLLGMDAIVLYFTLKICRLDLADAAILPLAPLIAFLVLLNGGYLALLTAVGGQTLGKMACGLKVVGTDDGSVGAGRAIARSALLLIAMLPAGVGLLPILFTSGRRGVHDHLAGTRVVRAEAAGE